jgi:CubicO group peptidase (beta-lactamase class C family)
MGILLAAEIVERITKTKLPDFLAKEVFAPLGMTRTALGLGSFKLEDTIRCQTEHAAPESGAGDPKRRLVGLEQPVLAESRRTVGRRTWHGGRCGAVSRQLHAPHRQSAAHGDGRLMIRNHTEGLEARRGIGFMIGPAGFGKGCSEKSFGHSGSTGTLAWADPATDTTCVILTSLPSRISSGTILHPVADMISVA